MGVPAVAQRLDHDLVIAARESLQGASPLGAAEPRQVAPKGHGPHRLRVPAARTPAKTRQNAGRQRPLLWPFSLCSFSTVRAATSLALLPWRPSFRADSRMCSYWRCSLGPIPLTCSFRGITNLP